MLERQDSQEACAALPTMLTSKFKSDSEDEANILAENFDCHNVYTPFRCSSALPAFRASEWDYVGIL